MSVSGQLFNLHHYNAVPPRSVRVWVDYGRDRGYGHTVEAEIRELLTHVPVWDGKPGVLHASRTLNADQFFVHGHLTGLHPDTEYHYRIRYSAGRETGLTGDATFRTAPRGVGEPFTFTAFGDEGIPGPSLDRDPSLLPESDWEEWNNGSYDAGDPDKPSRTHRNTTSAVISQITRVRNLTNGTPARFNLLAGDMCYANADGDIAPIINPDGPHGKQPGVGQHPGAAGQQRRLGLLRPVDLDQLVPDDRGQRGPHAVDGRHRQPRHRDVLLERGGGLRDGRELRAARVRRAGQADGPAGDRPGGMPVGLQLHLRQRRGAQPGRQRAELGDPGPAELQPAARRSAGWSTGCAAWRAGHEVDFIVAFFHECAFSTCNGHSSDGGVRARLAPLFARYQVDLAVQGHNHVYERTNPLVYDAATNSARSSRQAVSVSPGRARRRLASPGRDDLRDGRHRGHAAVRVDGAHETDRNFAAGKAAARPCTARPKTRDRALCQRARFQPAVRDRRLVAGPLRRLRLRRPRRHARPARAADHDDAAVHQRAGPRAGPGGLRPDRRRRAYQA